jgi:hypothetical protein
VLIDRDSVLTEQPVEALAHGLRFRLLPEDRVATSPTVGFAVEMFEPVEGFKPSKAYRTRLVWSDREGNSQSKLLLSDPATVLAIAVRGEELAASGETAEVVAINRQRRKPRRARRPVAEPEPA